MTLLSYSPEASLIRKIFVLCAIFFLIQLLIGIFLIYTVAKQQNISYLQQTTTRVREDITYQHGKWDMHRYNADPNIPDTYPLYILATNGYVLDRWKPLHGFLDTSDTNHLLSYQTIQTITTPVNQTWRMLSKPIFYQKDLIGVLTVAYFNPSQDSLDTIDTKLNQDILLIQSKITTSKQGINTTQLDTRDVPFDISFQIVDKFNQIITKNNNTNSIDRIPNFIDASYIGSVINQAPVKYVRDGTTNEIFLLLTSPIVDSNNTIVGVIVIGRSISYLYTILQDFIVAEVLMSIPLLLLFTFFFVRMIQFYTLRKQMQAVVPTKPVSKIRFNPKTGSLSLDDKEIEIPYATNQYYLCEALFSAPRKRWEIDDLLERFGEHDLTHGRKVYDTMLIINRKVSHILPEKLMITREKTYQINPNLVQYLQ